MDQLDSQHRIPTHLVVCALVALGLGAPSPAAGSPRPQDPAPVQDSGAEERPEVESREDLLAARRARKAQEVERPEPGFLSRYVTGPLHDVLDGLGGVQPGLEGNHSGAGLEVGLRWERRGLGEDYAPRSLPWRKDLSARLGYSSGGHLSGDAAFILRNVAGPQVHFELLGAHDEHPNDRLYLVSADGAERTGFRNTGTRVGARLRWEPRSSLNLTGSVERAFHDVGPGRSDDAPSSFDVRAPDRIPGAREEPDYANLGLSAQWSTLNVPELPSSGSLVGIALTRHEQTGGGDFDFWRFTADAARLFPFLHGRRVIALRARTELTTADSGAEVPFFLLPTLGGFDTLRGFDWHRFRGRNSLLLQAEYRWDAFAGLQMALFVDAGKVFEVRDEFFDVGDFEHSEGVGFRFRTVNELLLRLDVARSREGAQVYGGVRHVF